MVHGGTDEPMHYVTCITLCRPKKRARQPHGDMPVSPLDLARRGDCPARIRMPPSQRPIVNASSIARQIVIAERSIVDPLPSLPPSREGYGDVADIVVGPNDPDLITARAICLDRIDFHRVAVAAYTAGGL